MSDLAVFLLLGSRIPLYAYVFYKAWKFRKSTITISSFWLGTLALAAMGGALTNTFASQPITRLLLGYSVALSMFMLALTAKELKKLSRE